MGELSFGGVEVLLLRHEGDVVEVFRPVAESTRFVEFRGLDLCGSILNAAQAVGFYPRENRPPCVAVYCWRFVYRTLADLSAL